MLNLGSMSAFMQYRITQAAFWVPLVILPQQCNLPPKMSQDPLFRLKVSLHLQEMLDSL